MDNYPNGMPQAPDGMEFDQQPTQSQQPTQVQDPAQGQDPTRVREAPVDGTYVGATQEVPQAAPQPTPEPGPRKGKGAKGGRQFLMGLLGGVVGAAALVVALMGFGVLGGKSSGSATSPGTTQQITINADTEDATVAQAAAAKALPSVVSVYCTYSDGSGSGSGVILDTDGNIVTNYHVVNGAESITVTIEGKSYDATVVGTDSSSDLAVIKAELDGDTVTPIEVGDSSQLKVGSWVMSVGSPFGLEQSVSSGIVSALYRNELMESSSGETIYTNLIQVDASINPGNSGGALVDSEGKLVGICTLYSSDTESFAGIGFAIPGNYAIQVANKIIAGEPVTHAYIGLTMKTVNAYNAQRNHLSVNQGAYVVQVMDDSPAAEAGLEAGDIVVAMDDDEITSADGMVLAVRSHEIGDTVTVTVMRGDEEKTFQVTIGSDEALQNSQTTLNGNNDSNDQVQDFQQWYENMRNRSNGTSLN